MSKFFKAKRQDPDTLAAVQKRLDAIRPMVDAELRRQSQVSIQTGKPGKPSAQVWNDIARQQGVTFPDGYNVGPEGEVQYTNKTPWLQQAVWASTPFLGGYGAAKLAGALGGAGGAAASAGAPAATEAAIWGSPAAVAAGYGGAAAGGTKTALDMVKRTVGGTTGGSAIEEAIRLLTGLGIPALIAAKTNTGPSAEEKALMEQAKQAQALQMQRTQLQNPLFEAATRLAMSRLPTNMQQTIPGGFK